MNILVCLQTLFNPEELPELDPQQHFILNENEECLISNDFDLIALEAALQLKDENPNIHIACFSAGESDIALRKALAMGADEAFWLNVASLQLDARAVAEILCQFVALQPFDLILMGKLGVHYESQQTPQRLSKLLNIPCYNKAFSIQYSEDTPNTLLVRCEAEDGIPTYQAKLPCIITADLRLAEPRFPSLRGMIRAKTKPLHLLNAIDYHWEIPQETTLEPVSMPETQCRMIEFGEFLSLLNNASQR